MNGTFFPVLLLLAQVAPAPVPAPAAPPPQPSPRVAGEQAGPTDSASALAVVTLPEFAGVKPGDAVTGTWKVAGVNSTPEAVRFSLRDDAGRAFVLAASTVPGPKSPFDLAAVRLYFERTQLSTDVLAVPARAMAVALVAAAGSEEKLRDLVAAQIARTVRPQEKTNLLGGPRPGVGGPGGATPANAIDLAPFAGRWRASLETQGGAGGKVVGRCERTPQWNGTVLAEECVFTVDGREQRYRGTWGRGAGGGLWLFWVDAETGTGCFGASTPRPGDEAIELGLSCADTYLITLRIRRSASKPGNVVREWSLPERESRKNFVSTEERE